MSVILPLAHLRRAIIVISDVQMGENNSTHNLSRISLLVSLLLLLLALHHTPIERFNILGERQILIRNSPNFVAEGGSLSASFLVYVLLLNLGKGLVTTYSLTLNPFTLFSISRISDNFVPWTFLKLPSVTNLSILTLPELSS